MGRLLRSMGALFAALAILLALPAARAAADIRLDVVTGFDNNFRVGCWTPLQIRISGVSADTNAHVQVMVRTQFGTQVYGRSVRLRAGAVNGPVTVYYYHPDLIQGKDITIQVSADGRTLVEKPLDQIGNALSIPEGEPAIIGLTQDQSGLNFLAQLNLNYVHVGDRRDEYQNLYNNGFPSGLGKATYNRVIYPKAANLPDSAAAYSALDAAVLGDLPLDVLNEDQWAALVGWVKSGGILVVSGSADLNRLRSKQLAGILPIEPTRVEQLRSLQGLAYQYGSEPKVRVATVVAGNLKSDSLALCRQGDVPLVAERRLGTGLVIFTAFDMLAPEFRVWPGQGALWTEIMQRGTGGVRIVDGVRVATEPVRTYNRFGNFGDSGSNRALTDALAGVQSTEAPSFRTIGFFLVIYILMLVPGNYLVLRKLDRKELAWITIPVIIFLFSAGAYAVGYHIKGGQLYLHYCSVLEGAANTDGFDAYSVGSIFSPRQAKYDLSYADPAAMVTEVTEGGGPTQRDMGDLVVERDQKTTVKSALVQMWDHRQFDFQSFVNLGGQVSASVQPGGGNTVRVTVANGTRMPLSDCSVSYGSNQAMVGSLAPGESKTVRVSLSSSPGTAIQVIGASGQTTSRSVNDIKGALATLASTVSSFSQSVGAFGNASNPAQPVTTPRRTPFVMTGWFSDPAVPMSLEGETPVMTGANLLVVHLPAPEGQDGAPGPISYTPPNARSDPFAGSGLRSGGGMGGMAVPTAPSMVPGNAASAHNNAAYQYANSGDLNTALKEALLALKAAPNDGNIMDTVGEMYQRRKEYARAVAYYQKALKYLPPGSRTESEDKFGQTLLSQGKKQEAIKHLRIAAQDYSNPHGQTARQTLAGMGAAGLPSAPGSTGGITVLAQGQQIPPVPTTGRGSRRFRQPLPGGGAYLITQQWNYTQGASQSSQTLTFVPAGR